MKKGSHRDELSRLDEKQDCCIEKRCTSKYDTEYFSLTSLEM